MVNRAPFIIMRLIDPIWYNLQVMNDRININVGLPTPPSVIKTLVAGFNVVANHIYLILLPVALDLFIWLFPSINVTALFSPVVESLAVYTAELPAEASQMLNEMVANFNLTTLLRTLPIGVASLFSATVTHQNPLNFTNPIEVQSISQFLLGFSLFNIIGLVLGGMYYRLISDVSVKPIRPTLLRQIWRVLLLSAGWLAFFLALYIPISLLLLLLGLLEGFLQTIIIVVFLIPMSWLLLFVYYSYYPIFLNDNGVISTLKKTFHILRYSAPTLGWFSILALFLSQGLNNLWTSAPATSWISLIGIFGHGFISAGLLASSFIYFNKLSIWVDETMLWFGKNRQPDRDHIE